MCKYLFVVIKTFPNRNLILFQGSLSLNEFAIIRLSVLSPRSEGQVWGDVTIETQFERFSVPIHYRVAQGKLEIGPDRLVFDQCFPVSLFYAF